MDAKSLKSLLPELGRFLTRFDDCFHDHRCRKHLPVYVRGQLSSLPRKSVEPIAIKAQVPVRTLQEFLTHHDWDRHRLRDRLQQIVVADHSGAGSVGLLDETSFVKKGSHTPGVQRQWCGHLGKVENCIVTVHLGYTRGDFQCLIDADLFLPERWDQDRARCRKAGIPDAIVYRPKWRIALEQYDRAAANGIVFDWMTFDEGYGGKPEFLRELSKRRQHWVAEVPKSVYGWLTPPRLADSPFSTGKPGRPRSTPQLAVGQPQPRRLDELLTRQAKLKNAPWVRYRLDDRDKGPSVWEVKHVRFWPSEDGLPGPAWHLVVARHVLQGEEVKYFLANAPEGTSTATLLRVALTRHKVERCFQDQKSELGMSHYEGRTYEGLMRHLHVTQLSYLFAMRAVEARRGEKCGVDGATGASRGVGDAGRAGRGRLAAERADGGDREGVGVSSGSEP